MPRYEFKDEKSNKFWDISRDGNDVTTRWGRIGSDGQSKTKSFGDDAAATKEYDKLVASKTKKGYLLVEDGAPAGAPAASSATNPELEAAIRANPDDAAAYQVYGDWLQAQGDPLGELVSVQCAMAAGGDTAKLEEAEGKLMRVHTEAFFGPAHQDADNPGLSDENWSSYSKPKSWPSKVWKYGFSRTAWRFGFIERFYFDTGYYFEEEGRDEEAASTVLANMLVAPTAAFIREIDLRELWAKYWEDGEGPDMSAAVEVIGASPCARTLRRLHFLRGDHDISGTTLDASGLSDTCTNLEDLLLTAGNLTVGDLKFPKMRRFAARTGGFSATDMKKICELEMPLLEDLEVWFGNDEYGADCAIEDVAPLLARDLPHLKRLGLMNAEFGDDICKAVVGSPLLKQLEVLDLSMGIITDEGAKALLDARDALAHLEKLSIRGYFSADVALQLKTLAADRDIEVEGDMDDDYRYVECGE